MAAQLLVSALGVRIAIDFDDSVPRSAVQEISDGWVDTAVQAGPADVSIRVRAESASSGSGPFDLVVSDVREAAALLTSRVTLAAIEYQRSRLLMFHACGVASDDGQVHAFVGPSGTGKTTLVGELGRHLGYVTDETVGTDVHGRVLPYRKPLSRILGSGAKTQTPASRLGLLELPEAPLRLSSIHVLRRVPGSGSSPSTSDLPMLDAMAALIPEMSYLPELDQPLQRLAELITRIGGVSTLTYGEASSVVSWLERTEAEPTEPTEPERWVAVDTSIGDEPLLPGRFRRTAAADAIRVGDRLMLLHGSTVRILDGIGPFLWEAAASAVSAEALSVAVVDRYGSPTGVDPQDAVAAALDELVSAGVMRSGTP